MTVRRRAVAVVAATTTLLTAVGCSDELSDFCDALESQFDMSKLTRALDAGDDPAVERSLKDLRDLRDLAPPAIAEDTARVVDVTIATVRRITGVTGPDGETMPVDTDQLAGALSGVSPSAQRLREFADRECGITLSR